MIANWDDVEPRRRAKGEMDATWQALGNAAGTRAVGVNRIRIAPGKLSTPPHSHGASEEIYFVLGGSGLHWQDGETFDVARGDTVVHVANHYEHTFKAGDDGLDLIVFGTRHPTELGWLPRSRAIRIGWPWVEGRDDDPWDIEAQQGPLDVANRVERPSNVVALDALDEDEHGDRMASHTAGSVTTGMKWSRRAPGGEVAIPHSHSAEEEVFVVLDGGGTLDLWPSPRLASYGAEKERHELRAGDVVARPAGTRVAHCITAGDDGITCLVYGTRDPNDICYYPRSNKIGFRGVGVLARLESLDYWDGEPPRD